jgi:hypothetical protein
MKLSAILGCILLTSPVLAGEVCLHSGLRLGAGAGEIAAMDDAVRQFLGPGAPVDLGFGADLAGGTRFVALAGAQYRLGFCGAVWRVSGHLRPIAADLPDGIGIFTDPARLRGANAGLELTARASGPFGLWAEGGLGVEHTRLHLTSSFLDLESADLALVVPLRVGLDLNLGPGQIGVWGEASWAQGARGAMAGIGYSLRY